MYVLLRMQYICTKFVFMMLKDLAICILLNAYRVWQRTQHLHLKSLAKQHDLQNLHGNILAYIQPFPH